MKKTIFIVSFIWLALIGASFMWNFLNAKKEQETIALQTARSFFTQVVLTRAWNAEHGGVYVSVTKDTQPNPYLDDPLRDIEINENLTFTKINPAFMTRQIAEITARREAIQFHITSLNPIRPANKASPREEKALKAFENGIQEVGKIFKDEGNSRFFYMAPLRTEKECLKCHAKQGYREGDVRGGISVILSFIPKIPVMSLMIGHISIALFGLFGIVVFGTKLNKAYEEIRRQSIIDALTGIPNRRSFSDQILTEFNRSRRDKYPLSVIMGDIDNFKSYNDTYGHKGGDECLRKVANAIEQTLERPGDFCARYGGEEFVIILPNTRLKGAMLVAEKIRRNIQDMNIPHKKSLALGVVSISLGVAAVELSTSISYEELLKQSDEALYLAKEKGRNRIEAFHGLS